MPRGDLAPKISLAGVGIAGLGARTGAELIAAASTAAILVVILPVMIPLLLSCDARPEVCTLTKVRYVRSSPYRIASVRQGLRVIGEVI